MPAARLRRWSAAGRELRQCDPVRYRALLDLSERILRAHRMLLKAHNLRARDLATEVRRRLSR
jgi:hypothetical protein